MLPAWQRFAAEHKNAPEQCIRINPVHTQLDGDTLFTLGTGLAGKHPGMLLLCALAAEATARATLRAVQAARSITTPEGLHLPSVEDLG